MLVRHTRIRHWPYFLRNYTSVDATKCHEKKKIRHQECNLRIVCWVGFIRFCNVWHKSDHRRRRSCRRPRRGFCRVPVLNKRTEKLKELEVGYWTIRGLGTIESHGPGCRAGFEPPVMWSQLRAEDLTIQNTWRNASSSGKRTLWPTCRMSSMRKGPLSHRQMLCSCTSGGVWICLARCDEDISACEQLLCEAMDLRNNMTRTPMARAMKLMHARS